LDIRSVLFSLACQLAENLSQGADSTTMEQTEAQSNGFDERVALLQQHPILYKHVKAALEARSIKRLESELLQEPGKHHK
jgi:hypothetical protein